MVDGGMTLRFVRSRARCLVFAASFVCASAPGAALADDGEGHPWSGYGGGGGSGGCYAGPLGTCDTTFIGDGHGQFGADCWVQSPLDGQLPSQGSCGVITLITRYELLTVEPGQAISLDVIVDEVLFERSGVVYDSASGDGGVTISFSATRQSPVAGGGGRDGAWVVSESDAAWPQGVRHTLVAGGCEAEEPLAGGKYLIQAEIHTGLELNPGRLPDTGKAHARAIAHVESLRTITSNCA